MYSVIFRRIDVWNIEFSIQMVKCIWQKNQYWYLEIFFVSDISAFSTLRTLYNTNTDTNANCNFHSTIPIRIYYGWRKTYLDSKVHGANMGPIWDR